MIEIIFYLLGVITGIVVSLGILSLWVLFRIDAKEIKNKFIESIGVRNSKGVILEPMTQNEEAELEKGAWNEFTSKRKQNEITSTDMENG